MSFQSLSSALSFMPVFPVIAGVIFVAGVFLALIRVIGGVHYIHDVIAGAFLGILIGFLGFYVIF